MNNMMLAQSNTEKKLMMDDDDWWMLTDDRWLLMMIGDHWLMKKKTTRMQIQILHHPSAFNSNHPPLTVVFFFRCCFVRASYYSIYIFRCVCFPLAKGPEPICRFGARAPLRGYSVFTCFCSGVCRVVFFGFMELCIVFSSSVSGHQSSSAIINHQ